MRDLLLGGLLIWASIVALRSPWIGIMGWTVISIMNPHKYTWQLDSMPVAALIACATLIGVLVTKDRRQLPLTKETIALMAMMAWFTIVLLFSPNIEYDYEAWKKFMKIDLMILVALLVLHSKQHIIWLAWMLGISIGWYGFKGGLFTLSTGGSYRVWGPIGSYIEGNNELGLALIVVIPLLRFLQMQVANRWVKHTLTATMLLSAASALGTHSRGALLAIGAMVLVLWWRSPQKVITGTFLAVASVALITFMPDHWTARMNTIQTYDQDASAMGRINAWTMAWNLAVDRFFGGGFNVATFENFLRYAPDPNAIHAAHSIYFQILGETGFIGLTIFLLMWAFTWFTAGHLRREGRKRAETKWLADLGSMCQVSMAGYAVGGAFLSLAYFDLPYNIMVLVVLGRSWMERQAWKTETEPDRSSRVKRWLGLLLPPPKQPST